MAEEREEATSDEAMSGSSVDAAPTEPASVGEAPTVPAAPQTAGSKWTMRKPSTEAELRLALAQIEADGAKLPPGPAPRLVHARPDAPMRQKLQSVLLGTLSRGRRPLSQSNGGLSVTHKHTHHAVRCTFSKHKHTHHAPCGAPSLKRYSAGPSSATSRASSTTSRARIISR